MEEAMGEAQRLGAYLDEVREAVLRTVAPLSEDQLNQRPPGLLNTPGILLRHLAGSERYWIHRTVGGEALQRDREAEFALDVPVRKEEVLEEIRGVAERTRRILQGLADAALEETVEVQRGSERGMATKRYAILHTISHYSYHLGQLRIYMRLLAS
ncbi:MAG: DinB family protein [Armatimonadota bacterium]|nr:DinB family protein [Armatimonadota bacterium]MDR7438888.1 DinB family protein [Armatimonadota bacterium]MDR7562428.1 DinB family protein [Armatimonadota bacterium]MDR7568696.1 DinB family protein [Armatimonadota bacterium]MDR7601508.1 DinB family protein [Armatimonadota bacterium]